MRKVAETVTVQMHGCVFIVFLSASNGTEMFSGTVPFGKCNYSQWCGSKLHLPFMLHYWARSPE